ncbi:MAG: hypothetical protein H7Y15_15180 [Pseudonocardia sp.]|nr:hypothetical protein [Pseudonocardia sp.]
MLLLQVVIVLAARHPGLGDVGSDLSIFLTLIAAAATALALRPREEARERAAVRPVRYLDALLVTAMALTPVIAMRAVAFIVPGGGNTRDLQWAVVFAVGLTALFSVMTAARFAAASTGLTLVILYLTRYLVGGERGAWAALVHRESPPQIAWAVAASVLVMSIAAVMWWTERVTPTG